MGLDQTAARTITADVKGELGRNSWVTDDIVERVRAETDHKDFAPRDIMSCTVEIVDGGMQGQLVHFRITTDGLFAAGGERFRELVLEAPIDHFDRFQQAGLAGMLGLASPDRLPARLTAVSAPGNGIFTEDELRLRFCDPGEPIHPVDATALTVAEVRALLFNPQSGQHRAAAITVDELPRDVSSIVEAAQGLDGMHATAKNYLHRYLDEVVFCPRLDLEVLNGSVTTVQSFIPGWSSIRTALVRVPAGASDEAPSALAIAYRMVEIAAKYEGEEKRLSVEGPPGKSPFELSVASRCLTFLTWAATTVIPGSPDAVFVERQIAKRPA